MMDLIPGLPNDVARECLIRVPYKGFSAAACTCKAWKIEIESAVFSSQRKANGHSQTLFVMAQARVNPSASNSGPKIAVVPVYRLTVFEPLSGSWTELPPLPGCSDQLPLFCQIAGSGSDLVVMGGLDPTTWEASNSVYVYNFVYGTWRRGSDMPGVKRSFFGCVSDGSRFVYVAGGHDDGKNALRSAMVYDVTNDVWTRLPDMARERDECKGLFQHGKLHVIGGYCTEMQGKFERSAESFDVATWQWGPVIDATLESSMCPRTCVDGDKDGWLYMCRDGHVVAFDGSTWRAVAALPADVCNAALMTRWNNKLLVIGSAGFGGPYKAYVLDLSSYSWANVGSPKPFTGHVQAGCCLEI